MTMITLHHQFFWSLCEFIGDCFGPRYFSSAAAPSEKFLCPKQSPPISHNDLKKDGVQLFLSKQCFSMKMEENLISISILI